MNHIEFEQIESQAEQLMEAYRALLSENRLLHTQIQQLKMSLQHVIEALQQIEARL